MLSERNIETINCQIADELRIVGRSFTSQQEKMEAIERIAALKALIDTPAEKERLADDYTIRHIATELRRIFDR